MFQVGDKVSVLDDDIDGVVVSIKNQEVTIDTSDGFLLTFQANELIKIGNSAEIDVGSHHLGLDFEEMDDS